MTDIDELRARHTINHITGIACHERVPIANPEQLSVGIFRALLDELAALRSAQQWQPLSQDDAENVLLDCLKAMKVPGDDKCLIDEMRARGVWVYQKPTPTTAPQSRDSSNED